MRSVVFLLYAILLSAPAGAASGSQGPLSVKWEYATGADLPQSVAVDAGRRPYIYVALKSGGLLVLDTSEPQPAPAAIVGRSQLGGLDAMYVTQQGDRLYLALGDFFNAHGDKAGLAVVNIKNPKQPKVAATWSTDRPVQGAATVLVDGDYAYLGAMTEGVFVFEKSSLRLVSVIRPDPDYPRRNPSRTMRPNARGLAMYQDTLFIAYDAGGIRALDVSDKKNPREIGRYINPKVGLAKQQAFNNLVIDWPYAYAATDYCGMDVVDIRDPAHMRLAGWWNPWRCDKMSNLWFNSGGHTNQIGLDAARHLVYLSAGASELQVVNVADPASPRLAAQYRDAKKKQGAWGMTLAAEAVYLDYITAFIPFQGSWAGVRAVTR